MKRLLTTEFDKVGVVFEDLTVQKSVPQSSFNALLLNNQSSFGPLGFVHSHLNMNYKHLNQIILWGFKIGFSFKKELKSVISRGPVLGFNCKCSSA